ncbi:hypothetical protein Unana1_00135 [Umbelopsis nana]
MLASRISGVCRALRPLQRYSTEAAAKSRPPPLGSPANAKNPSGKSRVPSTKPRSHKLPDDPYLLSNKVKRLFAEGKIEEATELVKAAPIRLQSEVVWNQIIAGQAENGRSNAAFRSLTEMKQRGFKPNERTYTNLLKALANNPGENVLERAGDLHQTLQESNKMSVIHYNALIQVYARAGAHHQMMKTYKSMMENNISPGIYTYSILFNAFSRNNIGTFEELDTIWNDLQNKMAKSETDGLRRVKVDDRLIASLLNAIRNTGTLAKHFHVGMAAFDEAHGLKISGRGMRPSALNPANIIPPSSITFRALLLLLNKARKLGLADMYIERLDGRFKIDMPAMNAIIAIRYSQAKYADAVQCLDTMEKSNMRPNASTFDMLIQSCSRMYKGRVATDPVVWQNLSKILNRHAAEMRLRKSQGFPVKDLELSSKSCLQIMQIARAAADGVSTNDEKGDIYELTLRCIESQRWRSAANKVATEKHTLLSRWVADACKFLLETPFEKRKAPSEKTIESWKNSVFQADRSLKHNRQIPGYSREELSNDM